MSAPARVGHVVHWNRDKKYGKLRAGGQQFFVHRDDLVDGVALAPGMRVTFVPVEDPPRGPRGARVRPIGPECQAPVSLDPADSPRGPRAHAVQLREEGS